MIQEQLLHQLDRLATRQRYLIAWRRMAAVWLVAGVAAFLLWQWKSTAPVPPFQTFAAVLGVLGAALLGAAIVSGRTMREARDYAELARTIERAYPELQTSLLAAVEQRPEGPSGEFGYLQSRVIRDALDHAERHEWPELVTQEKLAWGAGVNVLTFAALAGMLIVATLARPEPRSIAQTPRTPELSGAALSLTIEPGDAEVERGASLLVLARAAGRMPSQATLVYQSEGAEEVRLDMPASLEDPLFGARVPAVESALSYHVVADDFTSPTYRVTVFEYPRLERADMALVYPSYTGLEPRTIQDVRTVTVVEGTQLTISCHLNKPVKSAVLTPVGPGDGETLTLAPDAGDLRLYTTAFTCRESRKLQLELVDADGRVAKKAERFSINVTPNLPPTLKPIFPARDLEVSALEEMDVRASVSDDFGVKRIGMTYAIAGQPMQDVELATDVSGKDRKEFAHRLKLEELAAEPDQLLSYHWWVEDLDPQGNVRRTSSDMYFAEVRPFDEIFRQGEPPPGGQQQRQQQQGQSQNAQQAEDLAKLQKDIINATWKVVRREITEKLTESFADDAEQIQLSQTTAIEQATALGEELQDEKSQAYLQDVLKHMQAAVEKLQAAHDGPSRDPLTPALASEQAAYQALLKLRAREHEIVQQQQQQGQAGQSASARSQQQRQQMDQLDMREEQNRYETQRQAQEQQEETAQDRENRQLLNRLRELAQRQGDLNDRVKELQSALEEAKTPMEQEEIRRQLQRLQEEQRQILQDTDELQSRMEQPENRDQTTEERQQLDETRDQVRRASEALQDEKVGQAAAAGSRAEQQFEDLREEFRRRASNRFGDEVQQMREAARQLEEREQEIAQQLNEPGENDENRPKAPSLREETPDSPTGDPLADQLGEQRQRLNELQEKMRETIEAAETTEPILSERLYDVARDIRDQNIERSLQATEQSVREGLTDDARQQEAAAGQGLKQLREGIERAAEGVLGDETEALRRARSELQDLSRELNQELNRNAPEMVAAETPNGDSGEPQSGQPQGAGQQPGERQPGEGQESDGDQRPGEGRQPGAGQQPGGDQRPGEGRQPGAGQQPGNDQRPGARRRPGANQPGQEPGEGNASQPGAGEQPGQGEPMPRGPQPGAGQPGQGEQPGEGQPMGEGQQPGAGQRPGQGEQPGQGQNGQQPGQGEQAGQGQQPGQAQQSGQGRLGQGRTGAGQPGEGDQPGRNATRQGGERLGGAAGPFDDYVPGEAAPLTGGGFREWSDRLRDVEEMVGDQELRADAARIRERARAMRADLQRHSQPPNWEIVRDEVLKPLAELEQRVAEEVLKRTSKKAIVLLDRDPVPPRYSEKTRVYYERLGSGR